jgi:hypothetical protein
MRSMHDARRQAVLQDRTRAEYAKRSLHWPSAARRWAPSSGWGESHEARIWGQRPGCGLAGLSDSLCRPLGSVPRGRPWPQVGLGKPVGSHDLADLPSAGNWSALTALSMCLVTLYR